MMPSCQGIELWRRAKKVIPGGNQLLSKRPEMFLPDYWPSYFKKAKGVQVWDLDNVQYTDMSLMGVGCCVLGYANQAVNRAVRQAIKLGNMSTLNCYEEVVLAEKLIDLHSWADSVRFARTGGEACALAIRIGRAFSGRDKVAFCGYHGWNDWYLAANLEDPENLREQLLPGLEPIGVPKALKGTSIPFYYGKIRSLEDILKKNEDIGVIMMEVQRTKDIDLEFLRAVQKIARRIGAVLIYDEVTSGFRLRTGGMHVLYDLQPDIVVLGKALGNGYPIAAVIGKKDIMEAAQRTFISSTYWTERVGFAAALAVIDQFENHQVVDRIQVRGEQIRSGLKKIFSSHGLKIEIGGLTCVPTILIQESSPLLVKTIFTQEMLKKGFLASTVIFVSDAHTPQIITRYLETANGVFGKIAACLKSGSLERILEGPVCHSGFMRLN
ncbi:MAG: aminotransferase class III-fold pyridoxal phosphate-dependent enzyme [Candidatus Omnitrophica bacterium]|nr:aminotransferase class III-fold pyridoxal phosphate-dependent enzyme [Candidatus Omnitrophota bacterium]